MCIRDRPQAGGPIVPTPVITIPGAGTTLGTSIASYVPSIPTVSNSPIGGASKIRLTPIILILMALVHIL